MAIHRRRIITPVLLLLLLLLVACGGSATPQTQKPVPTPSPTSGQGQQLLTTMAQKIRNAKTLHAILNATIVGQTFNGSIDTEVWNVAPSKSRTVVLQSSLPQFPTGSITVTDGKQLWQYNPAKKVVYTGPVPTTGIPSSNFNMAKAKGLLRASGLPMGSFLRQEGYCRRLPHTVAAVDS